MFNCTGIFCPSRCSRFLDDECLFCCGFDCLFRSCDVTVSSLNFGTLTGLAGPVPSLCQTFNYIARFTRFAPSPRSFKRNLLRSRQNPNANQVRPPHQRHRPPPNRTRLLSLPRRQNRKRIALLLLQRALLGPADDLLFRDKQREIERGGKDGCGEGFGG